MRTVMRTVIQEDLWLRGESIFAQADMEFLVFELGMESLMIQAHKESGASCFIIGAESYSEAFYRSIEPGSLVIRFGVGYDSVPLDICQERGILVANTPGTLRDSVAEHAIALLFSAARQIPLISHGVKQGHWPSICGTEVRGKTLAIIGFGEIGRTTAAIAKSGLGMYIRAFGKEATISPDHRDRIDVYTTDFASAVQGADFVSLHLSLDSTTEHFIDNDKLSLMPAHSILINTARGKLIHESHLYDALRRREVRGAALDVLTHEPYTAIDGKDLRTLDNVIITPHISSNTDASNRRMSELCLRNAVWFYEQDLDSLTLVPECRSYVKK